MLPGRERDVSDRGARVTAPQFFVAVLAVAFFLAFIVADDPGYVLRPLADLCFGGAPRTPNEWDRLFSFRRGFGWGAVVMLGSVVALASVLL